MSLESGNYISDLNATNPSGLDAKAEGDDHIRLIKKVLKNTFPGLTRPLGSNQVKSANYTVTSGDNYTLIEAGAPITITLPTIETLGTPFRLGVVGEAGAVTINPTTPNKINGSTQILVPSGQFIELIASSVNFYFASGAPSGVIVSWGGAIVDIPQGWKICDGTNGTPDLRDRFIIGAGHDYAVTAQGGNKDSILPAHTHGVYDPGHTHVYTAPNKPSSGGLSAEPIDQGAQQFTTNPAQTGVSINPAGVDPTNGNLPPYYALAFIRKD